MTLQTKPIGEVKDRILFLRIVEDFGFLFVKDLYARNVVSAFGEF